MFTKHLLEVLEQSGVQVEEAFKQVARRVYRDSHKAQYPWQEGLILGRFYFVPPNTGPVPPDPPPSPLAVGHLQVQVNAESGISLDGRSVGSAAPGRPLNLPNLSTGRYRIEARGQHGEPGVAQADIIAGQWIQVSLILPSQSIEFGASGSERDDPEIAERALRLDRSQRRQVQRWLNALGFSAGVEDGALGRRSREAIASYQRSLGAPPTGFLSTDNLRRLESAAAARLARLTVRSNVSGDAVYIDGTHRGSTRLDLEMAPGSYRLEVRKSGYKPWTGEVRLTAAQSKVVRAELVRQEPASADVPNQPPSNGIDLKIRSASTVPARVRPGQTVSITLDYSVGGNATITQSWVLRHDGKTVAELPKKTAYRSAGGWKAQAEITVPHSIRPGRYQVLHRIQAGGRSDSKVSSFRMVN